MTDLYILDDQEDMLELFCDAAELAGLQPIGYPSGKAFFQSVKDCSIESLMVLDLMMPDMDGIEVMQQLASMNHPPKLILVSGTDIGLLAGAEELGKARNLNIICTLTKPVDLKQFQTILLENS